MRTTGTKLEHPVRGAFEASKSVSESKGVAPAALVAGQNILGAKLEAEAAKQTVNARRTGGLSQVKLRTRSNEAPDAPTPSASTLDRAKLLALADRLKPAPADAAIAPAEPLGRFARLWRDFGVHPVDMFRRVAFEKKPQGGEVIAGGIVAEGRLLSELQSDLRSAVLDLKQNHGDGLTPAALDGFEARLTEIAASYGVNLTFKKGAPTVAWGDLPAVEVMHAGGDAAWHEAVHAIQFMIGGVAALSSAATAKIVEETGEPPTSRAQIRVAIDALSPQQRRAAFAAIVEPMDEQGYALLEEGAFHATGFMSKRARNVALYADRVVDNIDAYVTAYQTATLPQLGAAVDAKVYGGLGHVARTHGETTAIFFTGAAAYAQLIAVAASFDPVAGAVAALPAGYLLYRSVTG